MTASQRINTVFFDVETQRLADEVGAAPRNQPHPGRHLRARTG